MRIKIQVKLKILNLEFLTKIPLDLFSRVKFIYLNIIEQLIMEHIVINIIFIDRIVQNTTVLFYVLNIHVYQNGFTFFFHKLCSFD